MRKLARWLLTTAYWLMIIALPLLGLLSGVLLTSEAKPVWEIPIEKQNKCLGYISDEDGDCFLIHAGRSFNRHTQVTGLDIKTGKELYSKVIPDEEMIPGTTYQIIRNYGLWSRDDVLYDWKNEIEMDHFKTGGGSLTNPRIKADTLAWLIDESDIGTLYYKKLDGTNAVKVHSESSKESMFQPIVDIELSPDGEHALLLCQHIREASRTITHSLLVVDLKNRAVIQTIPDVTNAQWHSDSSSFMALTEAGPLPSIIWQLYTRIGTSFKKSGDSKPVIYGRVVSQMKGSYLVVNSSNIYDPIRRHISNYGEWCSQILKRLWPESFVMYVYRTDTGDLIKRLALPGVNWVALINPSFIHPNGQGIILRTDKTLAYWDLYPTSRWYPWIGLCLGLLLSILLVRRNLRRSMRVRPSNN